MDLLSRTGGLAVEVWHQVGGSAALVAAFITLLSWISAGIGATIAYASDPRHRSNRSLRGFLRFCFPKEVLLHRSAKLDYMWVVIHRLTYPFVIAPAITAAVLLGHGAQGWAEGIFGPPIHAGESWWASFAF